MELTFARLGGQWGWVVAYGVVSVLAGAVAIFWPHATLVVIALIFAIQLLVGSVYEFVFAFAIPNENGWLRALTALIAIASFIIAIYLLGHVGLTLLLLAFLLGLYWIAQGVVEFFVAIGHPGLKGRAWTAISGVISVIAGGVVIAAPGVSLVFLTLVLGIWLVIFGATLIGRGWALRTGARALAAA